MSLADTEDFNSETVILRTCFIRKVSTTVKRLTYTERGRRRRRRRRREREKKGETIPVTARGG
jgi:hypothetical protein